MRIALTEMRRRPGRFAAAGMILFLIAALLLLLGGLSDGLNDNRNGLIRNQPGRAVVYSAAADRQIAQSLITAEQRAQAEAADIGAVIGLSLAQLAARLPDRDPRDLLDLAVVGTDAGIAGMPEQIEAGTAWADRSLQDLGVEDGMTILIGPARTPVRIAGFAEDVGYFGRGTVWMAQPDFRELVAANKPDAVLPPGAVNILVVDGTDDSTLQTQVASSFDETLDDSLEVTTRDEAAEAIPEIDGGTLGQIIGTTTVIAAAVVALFFALLTSERAGLYAVFKAIGARDRTLLAGVVAQAVVLTLIALAAAIPVAVAFEVLVPPAAVPFALSPLRVLTSAVLLLAASAIGAALTVRRVLRIDPASAIGTAG